jgi:hypothetical protein
MKGDVKTIPQGHNGPHPVNPAHQSLGSPVVVVVPDPHPTINQAVEQTPIGKSIVQNYLEGKEVPGGNPWGYGTNRK